MVSPFLSRASFERGRGGDKRRLIAGWNMAHYTTPGRHCAERLSFQLAVAAGEMELQLVYRFNAAFAASVGCRNRFIAVRAFEI
jgi:hypothetical protein